MERCVALLAAAAFVVSATCETGNESAGADVDAQQLVVMSWNLEAFFDAEETGTEYDEYKKSRGWTETKYQERMDRLATVAEELAECGPDLIAVQEIENAATLEALAAGPFAAYGYRWTAFASEKGGSLGVGLLSRYPLSKIRVHSVGTPGLEAPRPILEARLEPGGAPLTVFVCHWKSKLGGEAETEAQRRASAGALARRLGELASTDAAAGAIALGDLNENIDEFQRRDGRYPTALLPDLREAADLLAARRKDDAFSFGGPFLVVSEARPPTSTQVPDAVPLYSPWFDAVWPGSYSYQKQWETIDHALLPASLFDGAGWEYASFSVLDLPPFTDEAGYPDGYDPLTGMGLSDHLPIVVELERR
jgi:endonuclease/exonuclease/phosphatase family metal-dependent hydrolase